MTYSFSQVEKALALFYQIAPQSRSAFANRIKHLQRKGFPPGVNTGRGKAADYSAEHVVLLALAFELISFGYTPEKAVAAIEDSIRKLAEGIDKVTDFEGSILCSFQPNGLSELQGKVRLKESDPPLSWVSAKQAIDGIDVVTSAQSAGTRIALFSLSGLVSVCCSLIGWEDNSDAHKHEFFGSLNSWAKGILDGDT